MRQWLKGLIFLVILVMVAHGGHSANVQWHTIAVHQDYSSGGTAGYSMSYPVLTMTGTFASSVLVLCADSYDYMEVASSWCRKESGDMISVDTIRQSPDYFYSADFDTDGHSGTIRTDYPISLNLGESVYLAVISRTYTSPDHYGIGWVELIYGNDGVLSSGLSAFDSDGAPMIVGYSPTPTPEPSSALLLLLGLGVLGLRKGRLAVGHEQLDFGLRTTDYGLWSLLIPDRDACGR